jgi:predicted nucleic acid-binding protein
VALRLSLDTTFLIDLQRERSRSAPDGPAHRFLRRSPEAELFLSAVALGEFAEGFSSAEHPIVRMVRQQHSLLPVDEETALIYSGVVRDLRSRGMLIGGNDLWIGSSSLRFRLPIVTADLEHFRRIDGLEVLGYRETDPPGEEVSGRSALS